MSLHIEVVFFSNHQKINSSLSHDNNSGNKEKANGPELKDKAVCCNQSK